MLGDEESQELRSLHARAYGPAGEAMSDEDLLRLRNLERLRNGRSDTETDDEEAHTPEAKTDRITEVHGDGTERAPVVRRGRAGAIGVLLVAAGLAVGFLGGWFGASTVPAVQGSVGLTLPELMRPATDEDVLDVTDADIDPSTTRYIATIDGFEVFLGRNIDQSMICVLTVNEVTGDRGNGCTLWNGGGNVDFASGVTPNLTIALGDVEGMGISGERVQLSESVLAVRQPAADG